MSDSLQTLRTTMHAMRTSDEASIRANISDLLYAVNIIMFLIVSVVLYIVLHQLYNNKNNALLIIFVCATMAVCLTIGPFYGWVASVLN